MKHSVQQYTSFLQLSSKRVFRCVNNLYLAVLKEVFLYVLPRNQCLCHNLRNMFQHWVTQQWLYMSQYVSHIDHVTENSSVYTIYKPSASPGFAQLQVGPQRKHHLQEFLCF
jgi:hypothetical protein